MLRLMFLTVLDVAVWVKCFISVQFEGDILKKDFLKEYNNLVIENEKLKQEL